MESREQRLAQLAAATAQLVKLVAELRGERARLGSQLLKSEREALQLRKEVATLRQEREVVRSRLVTIDESLSRALATESPAHSKTKRESAQPDKPVAEELTLF